MDIRKHVKSLIVRNPLYDIGLKDVNITDMLTLNNIQLFKYIFNQCNAIIT